MRRKAFKALCVVTLAVFEFCSVTGCNSNEKIVVDFDSVGGTPVEQQLLDSGDLIEEPSDVIKSGYVLDGWYYEGEEWDFNEPVYSDMTLVANWVSDTSVVNFLLNGGSMSTTSETYHYGEDVELPTPIRDGYIFLGWYYGDDIVSDGAWSIFGNVTLSACWAKEQISLCYKNGGEVIGTQTVEYGKPYELLSYSMNGIDAVGWYYEDVKIKLSGDIWNYSLDDVVLQPIWETKRYSLSVIGMDISDYSCASSALLSIGQENKLPIPSVNPSLDCGEFQGWFLNGQRVSDNKGNVSKDWFPDTDADNLEAVFGYPIDNAEDLAAIQNRKDGFFFLISDIDLGGIEWTPIGDYEDPFTGCLFGMNHEIRNFKVTNPTNYGGLFGYAEYSSFYSLTVSEAQFNYYSLLGTDTYCSALCAYGTNCRFVGINISASNSFNVSTRVSTAIIASVSNATDSYYSRCSNGADIECAVNSVSGIGADATEEWGRSHFENCINYGNLSSAGTVFGIGRGMNDDGPAYKNCINYGNLTGTSAATGIGYNSYQYFYPCYQNCINYGDINCESDFCCGIGCCGMSAYFDNSYTEDSPFYFNCINYGNVSSDANQAYGIGYADLRKNGYAQKAVGFGNCINYGNINAPDEAHGIGVADAGASKGSSGRRGVEFSYFRNCINVGTISSDYAAVGIGVGSCFEFCMNFGNLSMNNVIIVRGINDIVSLKSVLNCSKMDGIFIFPLAANISDYDCIDSYYCYTLGENVDTIYNTSIGQEITIEELTSQFLIEKMHYDEGVWNLENIDFVNKIFPTLKGKPFDDSETLKLKPTYEQIQTIMASW